MQWNGNITEWECTARTVFWYIHGPSLSFAMLEWKRRKTWVVWREEESLLWCQMSVQACNVLHFNVPTYVPWIKIAALLPNVGSRNSWNVATLVLFLFCVGFIGR